jgi:SprT protein
MSLQHKEILLRYFPEETVDQVSSLLMKYSIQLKITRDRVSKLGDYRPPVKYTKHRITINGNLGKYFIYLIFLHELAHLLVWNRYANKVQPHGKQWKEEFGSLLRQAIFLKMIPDLLVKPIHNFSLNVKATFASDDVLWKLLKSMDHRHEGEVTIEDIAVDSYFIAANGRIFKKENKLRKRYRCFCISNKRRYLFHPMAVIKPFNIQENS